MPRPAAASPYVPIPGGVWLGKVSSSDAGITATLTDLLDVYEGRCSDSALLQQMDDIEPDQAIDLLHRCLEGTGPAGEFEFRVVDERAGEGGIVRLQWDLRGSVAYNVPCYRIPNAATQLRDDFLVPLLRACVSARRLLPTDAAWPPPPPPSSATSGCRPPTLPDFAAAGLEGLLASLEPRAPRGGGSGEEEEEEEGGGGQSSIETGSTCVPAGATSIAEADAARDCPGGSSGAAAGPPLPAPDGSAAGAGPSAAAAMTAEEEQRKRAREKREKAAAKDKMRKLS